MRNLKEVRAGPRKWAVEGRVVMKRFLTAQGRICTVLGFGCPDAGTAGGKLRGVALYGGLRVGFGYPLIIPAEAPPSKDLSSSHGGSHRFWKTRLCPSGLK